MAENLDTWSNNYNEDLQECPICNILPVHNAYTYYYGDEPKKSKGEHETIRMYVCPKCHLGEAVVGERGEKYVIKEVPFIECPDPFAKGIHRRWWNKLVKNKEAIFRHIIKMGIHESN